MQVATALWTQPETAPAPAHLCEQVQAALGGPSVDLCLLLASAHYEDEFPRLVEQVYERLRPTAFIGGAAEAVVHDHFEFEGQPALTLWAARLPNVGARAFHLGQDDLASFDSPEALREYLGVPADERPSFIVLADPFTCGQGVLSLLDQCAVAYPGQPVIGGMLSSGDEPGQNLLAFDGQVLRTGLVGAALWGDISVSTIVSQGCRPIGRPLEITRAEQNVIQELAGQSPLSALTGVLRESRPRDVELARAGQLLVGRAIEPARRSYRPGDFLIRNPIGFDQETGALAIADYVEAGQTIQFHVLDAQSADEDLAELLHERPPRPTSGALLFTCNGRGSHLFAQRHHDAHAVAAECERPIAGMFCAGEIGPVGGRSYMHGHTAAIAYFGPLRVDDERRE